MYIKSTFDQQFEQISTFRTLSFETVSDSPHNHTCHYHQPLTLRNRPPFIVWLHNCSPLIVVITTNCRLIVLKLEYFSSLTQNYSLIYNSLTNCEGRVNLDLTFYLVLILVQGYHKCISATARHGWYKIF